MIKRNVQICSNCGTENPLFQKNCLSCKHYLRATIINIDLWKTVWQLFESPNEALKTIIFAKHKNFLLFLLLTLSVKFYLTSIIIQSAFSITNPNTSHFIYNLLLVVLIYFAMIILFSFFVTRLISIKQKVRFRDNLSVITFSFIPMILLFFIFFPVEYGIFGKHWFIYNPSPFLIKGALAYVLVILEGVTVIWSLLILYHAMYLQSNSKLFSLISLLLLLVILGVLMRYIPFVIL